MTRFESTPARELALVYLAHGRRTSDSDDGAVAPDFDAWEEVDDRWRLSPPDDVVDLLDALIAACETDADIAYVGAGPLENVLRGRRDCWDLIAQRCTTGGRFRAALGTAWIPHPLATELPTAIRDSVIILGE